MPLGAWERGIIQRFEQRFEQVDNRFEDMRADMNNRFGYMMLFLGFIISLIIALFGFMVWDRRTLMKPMSEQLWSLETDLEIKSSDGSIIKRFIRALRELASDDQKLANVLRHFHLL